jgi:hypothetical protein
MGARRDVRRRIKVSFARLPHMGVPHLVGGHGVEGKLEAPKRVLWRNRAVRLDVWRWGKAYE